MRILKNYKMFVEGKSADINNGEKINEGFFKNIGKGILDSVSKFTNYIKRKFGKDSWFYHGLLLTEQQTENSGVQFFPYSMSKDKQMQALEEIRKADTFEEDLEKAGEEGEGEEGLDVDVYGEMSEGEAQEAYESLKNQVLAMLNEENIVDLKHADPNIRNVDSDELKETIMRKFRLKLKSGQKFAQKGKDIDEEKYLKAGGTRQRSIFVWGAPGIGKTQILKQVANELGVDLIVWHLSVVEPADFMGVPGVTTDSTGKKRTTFHLPEIFPTSNGPENKGAILFFDELNRANESVLAAGLGLALDGKVGSYTLPSKVLVVAAGNRKEEVPSVTDIEPALSNRFAHVNLVPSFKNFEDYALTLGKSKVHPDVLAFLDFDKQFFHRLDTDVEEGSGMAWPSPRAWEAASEEYILALEENGDKPLSKKDTTNIFTEHIGGAAANSFANFVELKKHFTIKDLEDVYTKPEKAKLLPERPDIARAVVLGIAFFKKDDELSSQDIDNLFTYAMREKRVEMAVALMGYIKKVHPKVVKSKEYIGWLKKFNAHFKGQLK